MRNAVIAGSGSYAPEKILTNLYFNEILGEDVDTWLRENLTIRERRWCEDNQSTADLAYNAALKALESSHTDVREIDLIVVATDTPEFISPSTASVLQHRLEAVNAGTFDINTACAGFVTGLITGSKFIKADNDYSNVLVIGVYAMSKYLDLKDKKTVTLFADGAGAVVLKAGENEKSGLLTGMLYTEGQYNEWMGIYAGGTRLPVSHDVIRKKDHLLKFVKKFPKETNPDTWTKMVIHSCNRLGISPGEIDHFFFTQININSIRETMERIGVSAEKAYTIMDRYGYTGSACIPMAFDEIYRRGDIRPDDLVCFMGSGGGLAFANAIFRM